jgi:hypothetical protein
VRAFVRHAGAQAEGALRGDGEAVRVHHGQRYDDGVHEGTLAPAPCLPASLHREARSVRPWHAVQGCGVCRGDHRARGLGYSNGTPTPRPTISASTGVSALGEAATYSVQVVGELGKWTEKRLWGSFVVGDTLPELLYAVPPAEVSPSLLTLSTMWIRE